MKPIFEKIILIKFGDADPQGILYFARTLELAHQCIEEFWAVSPLGWTYWFQNPEFAVPLRHSSSDYLSPMHAGQTYAAKLSVAKIGESSVEFVCEFFGKTVKENMATADSLCARVSTVHVFVSRKNFMKIPVPETVRQTLK